MKKYILYIIDKRKINATGLCNILCRITFKKQRKVFSTGFNVKPEDWDNRKQKILQTDRDFEYKNTQLSLIKSNLNQAFLYLQVQKLTFDVDDIYLQYKGENVKTEKTIADVFEMHNSRMKKLIGSDYTKSTYSKFIEAKNHTMNFIKFQYKKKDFLLEDLNMKFLQDFDYYLKSEKKQKQITINKSIQRLRKIVKLALSEGFIFTDPFLLYKPKKALNTVTFLTQEELKELENHNFSQIRLQHVRDCFIFCCYTGLAFAEMEALQTKHIVEGFDNQRWIKMYRKKTGKVINIPLLAKPIEILNKYSLESSILPIISNQKFNSYLKEIAEIVGIEKRLTHHVARKTFATTVLLYNDVPMEIVSELLGHSSMVITQEHYGKIVQKKVSEEMLKLASKINEKEK